jgi:hypothetical protein
VLREECIFYSLWAIEHRVEEKSLSSLVAA